jgi:hypothetical protein
LGWLDLGVERPGEQLVTLTFWQSKKKNSDNQNNELPRGDQTYGVLLCEEKLPKSHYN